MEHFDLAVIGSGSGNSIATHDLAHWRIAFIEQGVFGGTCLNVGCIPTKMYVYAADLAERITESQRLGVDATLHGVDWDAVRDRIFGRIDPISASGREYRRSGSAHNALYEAHASFVDAHTLDLSGERITADQIVIAAGSSPQIPDVITESGVRYETSATVMRLTARPGRMAIYGGGYIAAEFAHVFASFGSAVTVISRTAPLLRHLDHDIAERFTALAARRYDVRLGTTITAAEQAGAEVRLTLSDGSSVVADTLLVATGRRPNSDGLNLSAAGVRTRTDGRIVVDNHQRTTTDGIWALGDVCSPHQLKHVSNHEARVVAHNLAHPEALVASDHRYVPAAVFTDPQLAGVGLTEHEAAESGRRFVTATQRYADTAYGWAMEDTTGFCKVIADPSTGALLGAHIMGDQASTLIQPLIQALHFGTHAHQLARGQYWIHPALTEVVENALLALPLD